MTSELILYLEPTRNSTLWTQVYEFYKLCRAQPWSHNEALRYPAHITTVGFFDDRSTGTATTTTTTSTVASDSTPTPAHLIQYLDQQIAMLKSKHGGLAESILIKGLIRPRPDNLLLAVEPAPELLEMTLRWQTTFPELGLRLKKINHLSLCYWTEEQALQPQEQEDEELRSRWIDQAALLAQQCLSILHSYPLSSSSLLSSGTAVVDNLNSASHDKMLSSSLTPPPEAAWVVNESWDIALYTISNRDKADHQPYPLRELHRWTL
ncbi:hypothetical protein BGZ98_000593 [Dissophora globulifera]|nr:hypothetical protein BGZ98_000593 [Dissophora globulifera]